MRWPWSHPETESEGTQARMEADINLRKAQARWPEVTRVARSLRDLRERNHFAASVTELFHGERR